MLRLQCVCVKFYIHRTGERLGGCVSSYVIKHLSSNETFLDLQAALIMQVLQLTDQQIAMLPPEQRQSILILKEQISKSAAQWTVSSAAHWAEVSVHWAVTSNHRDVTSNHWAVTSSHLSRTFRKNFHIFPQNLIHCINKNFIFFWNILLLMFCKQAHHC